MKCKMCNKVFTPYKLYDLKADLKADAYICKGCLMMETVKWNIENPTEMRLWKFFDEGVIVYPKE